MTPKEWLIASLTGSMVVVCGVLIIQHWFPLPRVARRAEDRPAGLVRTVQTLVTTKGVEGAPDGQAKETATADPKVAGRSTKPKTSFINSDGTILELDDSEIAARGMKLGGQRNERASIESLQPTRFPEEVESYLKNSGSTAANDVRLLNETIKAGERTALGNMAEAVLRSEMAAQPEAPTLKYSVSCAAKLCELQVLQSSDPLTGDARAGSIDSVVKRISSNPTFKASHRLRRNLSIPSVAGGYEVWYWSERE